jgi:hypothetical protein
VRDAECGSAGSDARCMEARVVGADKISMRLFMTEEMFNSMFKTIKMMHDVDLSHCLNSAE